MPAAPTHQSDIVEPFGASLFEASEDCVKLLSLDGVLEGMNANGVCLMEIDDFDALRGLPWTALWPEAERGKIAAAVAHAAAGQVARLSADCPTAKGTTKSWDVIVSPVLDHTGRPVRLVSISRDVTELARAQEQNRLLTQELSHRIKNIYAVVDGVVSLSARAAAQEIQPFAAALRERLRSLGRALVFVAPGPAPGRGAQTLRGLLDTLLEPYGGEADGQRRVVVSGDDLAIGPLATSSVALFIHELATNALKYGALGQPQGRVTVSIASKPEAVEMLWREHGCAPADPAGDGFGSVLMENAVCRQLGGRLLREWGPTGLAVHIHIPAGNLSA